VSELILAIQPHDLSKLTPHMLLTIMLIDVIVDRPVLSIMENNDFSKYHYAYLITLSTESIMYCRTIGLFKHYRHNVCTCIFVRVIYIGVLYLDTVRVNGSVFCVVFVVCASLVSINVIACFSHSVSILILL
jgi:hypothetical protein